MFLWSHAAPAQIGPDAAAPVFLGPVSEQINLLSIEAAIAEKNTFDNLKKIQKHLPGTKEEKRETLEIVIKNLYIYITNESKSTLEIISQKILQNQGNKFFINHLEQFSDVVQDFNSKLNDYNPSKPGFFKKEDTLEFTLEVLNRLAYFKIEIFKLKILFFKILPYEQYQSDLEMELNKIKWKYGDFSLVFIFAI